MSFYYVAKYDHVVIGLCGDEETNAKYQNDLKWFVENKLVIKDLLFFRECILLLDIF